MIKIELNRLNNDVNMEAVDAMGNKVIMDGSPSDGGQDKGFRPMQMLLAAAGGCSSIDVVNILKKQREELKDIKITITGERAPSEVPSLFTQVHLHFKLFGNIDTDKAQKAVALSVGKYCSVVKTLEKTAKVTFSVEVIND